MTLSTADLEQLLSLTLAALRANASGASAVGKAEATVAAVAVPASDQPGYDATQKLDAGAIDPFAKTAVISRDGATSHPGGDTDAKA